MANVIELPGLDIRIRPLDPGDSIDAITELLHRAYAGLATQGLHFLATHQDASITRERMNDDLSFVAEHQQGIVGTITLYQTRSDVDCAWYGSQGVYHFGQFGIEPWLQRRGLGTAMMKFIEQCAVHEGARELACDTAEPALHLVAWYTSMGYRFIQHVQWPEVNYRSVILSKTL